MDLRIPSGGWIEKDEAWESLIARLFSFLQEVLAQGVPLDFNALDSDLATWEPFIEFNDKGRDKRSTQWHAARRLLWCAKQASSIAKLDWDEIHRVIFTMADTPEFIKGHEGWALDCMRVLRRASVDQRSSRVSVALSDELLQDSGSLATLVLDILKPGGGQVFHHPEDSLKSYPYPDFDKAMQDAWAAAKELARKEGTDVLFDGRWRLLDNDGRPVKEVCGRSASGAAARGWYHALRGTVPDEGVIVLAQVDITGVLQGVSGVPAKVKTIVEDGHIDTIVVASQENRAEAEATLRTLGKLGPIRVVNLDASEA